MNKNIADKFSILFNDGISRYEQGDYIGAEEKFFEAYDYDPYDEALLYNLSLVYLKQGKFHLTLHYIKFINSIDLAPLIREMDKIKNNNTNKIPDSIPACCYQCEFFKNFPNNTVEGFCNFYLIESNPENECFALSKDAKIRLGEAKVEEALFSQEKLKFKKLIQEIETVQLPEKIICMYCNAEIQLTENEQQKLEFTCKNCNRNVDYTVEVLNLKNKYVTMSDEELLSVIMYKDDYNVPTVICAKKIILERNSIKDNFEVFIGLLKKKEMLQTRKNIPLSLPLRVLMFILPFGIPQMFLSEYFKNRGFTKKADECWTWMIYGFLFYLVLSYIYLMIKLN